jgi:L-threonylcarbamoyladenylate synthase
MRIVPATEESIAEAARLLKSGELVGMPTETVYGIAADALNVNAVKATFTAKGRPAENPLIVHVASPEQARKLVNQFPPEAETLANRFWPGPLTLVLKKSSVVPDEVTAGLDTIAVRMPAHAVALMLIEVSGLALSAPSANTFMGLSPTSAEMISPGIATRLAMILDGGPCAVGIESTVLDLAGDRPVVLRHGDVSVLQLEEALGVTVLDSAEGERRSPGMYPRHYAPRAEVKIVDRLDPDQPGLVLTGEAGPLRFRMPSNAQEYARDLYKRLNELDLLEVERIYVEAPPRTDEWRAVWDRLAKASHPKM